MTNATAQKHVSKLIKVLYKLTLQSIYGTKIAQNNHQPAPVWPWIPSGHGFRHDYDFHNNTKRSSTP